MWCPWLKKKIKIKLQKIHWTAGSKFQQGWDPWSCWRDSSSWSEHRTCVKDSTMPFAGQTRDSWGTLSEAFAEGKNSSSTSGFWKETRWTQTFLYRLPKTRKSCALVSPLLCMYLCIEGQEKLHKHPPPPASTEGDRAGVPGITPLLEIQLQLQSNSPSISPRARAILAGGCGRSPSRLCTDQSFQVFPSNTSRAHAKRGEVGNVHQVAEFGSKAKRKSLCCQISAAR